MTDTYPQYSSISRTTRATIAAWYAIYIVVLALPTAIVLPVVVIWANSSKSVFMDFHTSIPDATKWIMDVCAWLSDSTLAWYMVIIIVLALPLLLAIVTCKFKSQIERILVALIIGMMVTFASLATIVVVVFALSLPFIETIKSVTGGR